MQLSSISEVPQLFAKGGSLPEICSCLQKAAYDPRIKGIFIKVNLLSQALPIRTLATIYRNLPVRVDGSFNNFTFYSVLVVCLGMRSTDGGGYRKDLNLYGSINAYLLNPLYKISGS